MPNMPGGCQLKSNPDIYHRQPDIQGQVIMDVCRRAKGGRRNIRRNHLLRKKKGFLWTFIQKRDISWAELHQVTQGIQFQWMWAQKYSKRNPSEKINRWRKHPQCSRQIQIENHNLRYSVNKYPGFLKQKISPCSYLLYRQDNESGLKKRGRMLDHTVSWTSTSHTMLFLARMTNLLLQSNAWQSTTHLFLVCVWSI